MKKFKLKNTETNEIVLMSMREILENINRDRSAEWSNYTEEDWLEGLEQFTEFELIE